MIIRRWTLLGLLIFFFSASTQAQTYTYHDLVDRLTNLDLLAIAPAVGEKTLLASSYDRHSQYDAQHDKYILWGANGDGDGVVRMEGKQAVLADIQGPGCIFRIWSAKAKQGHVKLYLDGNATPAIDLPFTSYFDGKTKPFDRPAIVYKTTSVDKAGGLNNFTPIPFQKSCKIVADPDWGVYYQITYTQFGRDTIVPTFHLDLSSEDSAALDRANLILSKTADNRAGMHPGEQTEKRAIQCLPGTSTSVIELNGQQAITAMRMKLAMPLDADKAAALLRQLAIQITWDGDKSPSVWSPLGDFFAYFGGGKPFDSLLLGLTSDGTFYSYWYMPFASSAKIEITNDGPAPVPMDIEISHAPLATPIEKLNRFHAKWHRDAFLPQRPDRQPDWTLLTTQGSGRYVGTQLHVWNPRGSWWGEGDDKFFVDGEKFPSSFGTGSEDYFGAAWGLSPFDRPFHGLVETDPAAGHFVVHRWHIAESLPFQKSFEAALEKYYPNTKPTLYDAVAYWYLDPKGVDPYIAAPVSDRTNLYLPPPIYHEPDAIEAEDMRLVSQSPENSFRRHDAAGDSFPPLIVSGDKYLSWRPAIVGEKLEVAFTVKTAGNYHLTGRFLHRAMGGVFRMGLDGAALGDPVDLYGLPKEGQAMIAAEPVDLGIYDFGAGDHILSAEYRGKNAAAPNPGGTADFALDYIKLIPEAKR